MTNFPKILLTLTLMLFSIVTINAQAALSVQGILKKSNGVAVDDGLYDITFKLYTAAAGDTAIWSEPQTNVEVSSGIYSAVLGQNAAYPLNVPFDVPYFLGVTIGSSELAPRIVLTSAPYALSLIGNTNQFPSSGKVLADSMQLDGGMLVSGGTPGVNGANHNGYAFTGNNGDKDSGLFSTGDGKVELYANNVERLRADDSGVTIQGNTTVTDLNLSNNGKVIYNGTHADWRLVEVDDFNDNTDSEGWNVYGPATGTGQNTGWNNSASSGDAPIAPGGAFVGNILYPTSNQQVLKKYFAPSGSFSQIKVKFRYYFIDSWGTGVGDMPFAGFANDLSSTAFKVAWTFSYAYGFAHNNSFNNSTFYNATNIIGSLANWGDHWVDAEMTARASGSSFYVVIGAELDEATSNESYGVGSVEVWVR